MDGGQRRRRADGEPFERGAPARPLPVDELAQRRPGHELADDERLVAGEVGVQDGGRAEGRDPLRQRDLAQEPLPRLRIGRQPGVQQLDRDLLARRTAPEEDDALAALPEPVDERERAQAVGIPSL
ncbi:hypothetical protein GCM10027612_63240 [Microbispora bryophytorum subsp. camponoti]